MEKIKPLSYDNHAIADSKKRKNSNDMIYMQQNESLINEFNSKK
jgi:hypothetical protein